MPDYRRYFVRGGTFFFTLVTAERSKLFSHPAARLLFGTILREARRNAPFETLAIVLLPDHLHTIWTLPPDDCEYSRRWQAIKARFTAEWIRHGGEERSVSGGYSRQRRRGIWQPRFIEHTIRDEEDLARHADYIHYNPVKHGHVRRPWDWEWSSFRRFVLAGEYPQDWGSADLPPPSLGKIREGLLE